jgi:hypothetical protein
MPGETLLRASCFLFLLNSPSSFGRLGAHMLSILQLARVQVPQREISLDW